MTQWEFEQIAAESNVKRAEKMLSANPDGAKKLFAFAAKNYRKAADLCPDGGKKAEFLSLAEQYEKSASAAHVGRPAGQPANGTPQRPVTAAQSTATPTPPASAAEQPTLEEAVGRLNELIGLGSVKKIVDGWIKQNAIFEMRRQNNMPVVAGMSYHMVFTGNPGTGKTTVARLIGQIYRALGLIEQGQLVEVKRNDLVAGYVGQTAIKTKEAIDKALGGVLFIDEAYTLSNAGGGNDFGHEAIDTLLAEMENNRNNLVVIVAGYTDNMQTFIDSNPGLKSRFKTVVDFPDYSAAELYRIFMSNVKKYGYRLNDEAEARLKKYLSFLVGHKGKDFGNARDMRNIFENTVTRQSNRLFGTSPDKEQLETLLPEDLALPAFDENAAAAERPQTVRAPSPVPEADERQENSDNEDKKDVSPFDYKGSYVFPPLSLLAEHGEDAELGEKNRRDIENIIEVLENKLADFGIKVKTENHITGATFSRIELRLLSNTSLAQIAKYENDITMALKRKVRLLLPIEGKDLIGVEVENADRDGVVLKTMLTSEAAQKRQPANIGIGVDIEYHPHFMNLDSLPHLLVAGTTGSGKSCFLHSIINGIFYRYTPEQIRLVLIDFKRVELGVYNGLPFLVGGYIMDEHESATGILTQLDEEMERRYALFLENGVHNIAEYNEKMPEKLPLILTVIDEYADLVGSKYEKQVEQLIMRLAQKARACGIHLVISTQRPTVKVINGVIKANFPTRIAFSVASHVDSTNILDATGAQNLVGKGDMLLSYYNKMTRLQAPFISFGEITAVAKYIKEHN